MTTGGTEELIEVVEDLFFSPVNALENLLEEGDAEAEQEGSMEVDRDESPQESPPPSPAPSPPPEPRAPSPGTAVEAKRGSMRRRVQVAAIVVVVVFLLVSVVLLPVNDVLGSVVTGLQDMRDSVGFVWSALLFFLVYVIVVVTMLPAVVLTLAAGLIFGLLPGTLVVWSGMFVGCCVAFLIGRLLCREWVEGLAASLSWFKLADDAVAQVGWKIVLLLRLSPMVPYNVLNYVLALTKISFYDYAWASFVGMFPGILMFTYLGSITSDLLVESSDSYSYSNIIYMILAVLFTIISFVLINVITAREVRKLMDLERINHVTDDDIDV